MDENIIQQNRRQEVINDMNNFISLMEKEIFEREIKLEYSFCFRETKSIKSRIKWMRISLSDDQMFFILLKDYFSMIKSLSLVDFVFGITKKQNNSL